MDSFSIESYKGEYSVYMEDKLFSRIQDDSVKRNNFYIIDENISSLYKEQLSVLLNEDNHILITASENNKSLEKIPALVNELAEKGVKRGWHLVAIGGGITQDICCFIASCLYRGLDWSFYPTTLLAQADSCIGSKSSINCGSFKNIVGTFAPPKKVYINIRFLDTLLEEDLKSGIGEILKVSLIDGPEFSKKLFVDYEQLLSDKEMLKKYILKALQVKKVYIQKDEFDKNIRNIFNYGHSFGHAIEAATHFGIPHGIAVTIGMDVANYYSYKVGRVSFEYFAQAHQVFFKNYCAFVATEIDFEFFLLSLTRDKKNTKQGSLVLILPNKDEAIEKVEVVFDAQAKALFKEYFQNIFKISDFLMKEKAVEA